MADCDTTGSGVGLLAKQIRRRKPEVAKSDALFALSAMVGAATLSQIVTDPDLFRPLSCVTQKGVYQRVSIAT
jgi:hypothetical protein